MKISYRSGKKYGLFSFLFFLNLIIHDVKSLPCWQLNSDILAAHRTRNELVVNHNFTNLHDFIFKKYFPGNSTNYNLYDSDFSSSFFDHCFKLATVKKLKNRPVVTTSRIIALIHKSFILHQSSNEDLNLFC